jgi:hypothetical protein
MQAPWNGLGSKINLDFILMSVYLNSQAKGAFFNGFQQEYVDDPAWKMPDDLAGWHWAKDDIQTPQGTDRSAASALFLSIGKMEQTLYGVLVCILTQPFEQTAQINPRR